MTALEKQIYDIVRKIPRGKVLTYGDVAVLAGNKKLARVVGNVMHKNPLPYLSLAEQCGFSCADSNFNLKSQESENHGSEKFNSDFLPVPCHRVVNSKGQMGKNFGLGGPEIQSKMLCAEGIEVLDGTVNLKKYSAVDCI